MKRLLVIMLIGLVLLSACSSLAPSSTTPQADPILDEEQTKRSEYHDFFINSMKEGSALNTEIFMLEKKEVEIQQNWLKENGISLYDLAKNKDTQEEWGIYIEQNYEWKSIHSEITLKKQQLEELMQLSELTFEEWLSYSQNTKGK